MRRKALPARVCWAVVLSCAMANSVRGATTLFESLSIQVFALARNRVHQSARHTDSVLARRWGARHGAVHCAPRGVSNEGSIKSACHIWFDQAMRSHRATLRTLCTQARSGSPRGAATMQPKALLHTPQMIALGDNLRGGTNHEGDLAFALGWRPARSSRVRMCAQEGTGDASTDPNLSLIHI